MLLGLDLKNGKKGGFYMRDFYIEVIKKYVESKQMKDYLISVVDELCKWQIIDLICGARANLKDKYETLNLIAEYENDEERKDEYQSATLAASSAKAALDQIKYEKMYIAQGVSFEKVKEFMEWYK